jgi:Protein of unknown function (DUF3237)
MGSADAGEPDGKTEIVESSRDIPGELLYEYVPQVTITKVVEFGISADAVLLHGVAPPAEGARFDFNLEGHIAGPNLSGTLQGVDYLNIRADGRGELHIHAGIETGDGMMISLSASGIVFRNDGSPLLQLRENVGLTSNHPELSWVNHLQIWASGTVDISTGRVHVKAYSV